MQPKPQILCWLTCDGVHIDPGTGKHTLLGVFSSIRARQFPFSHPFMIWFLTITDVTTGEHRVRISMGHGTSAPQTLIDRKFESKGPLQRINLINEIRSLTFPQPGDYGILIEIDDDVLLSTNMTISD